jgi:hypothetical protein
MTALNATFLDLSKPALFCSTIESAEASRRPPTIEAGRVLRAKNLFSVRIRLQQSFQNTMQQALYIFSVGKLLEDSHNADHNPGKERQLLARHHA